MAKQIQDPKEEDPIVRLKPILGLTPTQYLPVVYAILGLLVLFIVLVAPGIRNNGSHVAFQIEPFGAAVYIDNQFACTAPCTVFVNKGNREIRAEFPGFTPLSQRQTIEGRIFGSLIFPKKAGLAFILEVGNFDDLLERSAREFAEWGMVDRFYATYRPEPVLTNGALGAYSAPADQRDSYTDMVRASLMYAHEEILTKDIMKAVVSVNTGPGPLSASAYVDLLQKFIHVQSEYQNASFWLFQTLRPPRIETLGNATWFRSTLEKYENTLAAYSPPQIAEAESIAVRGHQFTRLPATTTVVGSNMAGTDTHPYPAKIDEFYILDREVTNEMYAIFIAENSAWNPDVLPSLVDKKLVENTYLQAMATTPPNTPITFVSFFAAEAYCTWLTTQLPNSLQNYEIRLPMSAEWEYAARIFEQADAIFKSGSISGPSPIRSTAPVQDLMGNVWEWCAEGYYPSGTTLTDWESGASLSSEYRYAPTERIVRGGSWANTSREIEVYSVGSQPPHWCTEVLGFRPVLVRRNVDG